MAGLVEKIRSDVKKAGTSKRKFTYIRDGEKRRIRFLTDMDDGVEVTFHDSYSEGITPVPCQEVFGRPCPYCDREGIRTRSQYVWSVWDYEDKEVALFMYPVNICSPVPHLVNMWETYGTLLDRDYVIGVTGKQQNKTFSVIPMDKVKFRNDKAKPFSYKQILKMIDKAYPCEESNGEEDEEDDDFPVNKPSKGSGKQKTGKKPDSEWNEGKLPPREELDEMSPAELYNLCKERDIDVKKRLGADDYVEKLEEWREKNEGDDDYDNDQDWGEEDEGEPDYYKLTPKELYELCVEKEIDVQPRKPARYYVNALEENKKALDDWGSDDEWEEEQ